ncbi:N-acetyl-D-glucosamine kinase [Leucoagaricus sp. SymC.cos]|nr:N-acetyl-D-glucosamine kinase [Leucoagaricus sp. SymC.cos]
MSYFLCVDCGGSKTAAVIADRKRIIIGRGYAGPSNLTYLTSDAYTQAVKTAVAEALAAASLSTDLPPNGPSPFEVAWFGASGADSPAVIKSVLEPLSQLIGIPIGPKLLVTNDTHLLAAPIRLYDDVSHAVSVISGTGAIAVSFKEENDQIIECGRAGGWGWILGDEGGGYDVGREALRQILRAHDRASVAEGGIQPSALRDRVLKRFEITDVMEILRCVYLPDPIPGTVVGPDSPASNFAREKRLSTLSPVVFEAAFVDKDPLALNVLRASAKALVNTAMTVTGTPTSEKPRLVDPASAVLSFGGSLAGVEDYQKMILEEFEKRGAVFKHVSFVEDAAKEGAVSLVAVAERRL